jgi:two-component system, NarL family, sensor histidine kinase DesK
VTAGRPDRSRPLLVVPILSAALLTSAVAGVGVLLEPDPAPGLVGGAVLVAVLAAQGTALHRSLPASGTATGRAWTLAVLAVLTAASVPLLAPAGVAQGWETWAWLAAGLAGSAPLLVGWRAGAATALALTAVSAGVGQWLAAAPGTYALLTAGTGAGLLLVHLIPLRLWHLVTEARAGRDAAARLAAAEERLRFAADVHDLLGHHLTVIALQAELAARTARTDPAAAADHAEQARSLAATALVEMRRVVHGYRETDVAAQLAAVAQVLRASGIRCTLAGPAQPLPDDAGAALAATAREAGTNVLRHSRARWCSIALVRSDGRAELTFINDGAPGAGPADPHSAGLRGLTDRLATLGGTLDTEVDGDVFTLRAAVPIP